MFHLQHNNLWKRQRSFSEELDTLNDRIDTEVVDKDEFAELFKSAYLTIVRTTQPVSQAI
jgi:hypothetical protein